MVFVQADKEVVSTLKKEGIQITEQLENASVMVAAFPWGMKPDVGIPVIPVLTKVASYEELEPVRDSVTTLNELPRIIREKTTSAGSFAISFSAQQSQEEFVRNNRQGVQAFVPGQQLVSETSLVGQQQAPFIERHQASFSDEQRIVDQQHTPVMDKRIEQPASLVERQQAFLTDSRILASFSTKGGAGKTALATNLGALYAMQGYKVVLVDLDIGTGNIHYVLKMDSALEGPTVANWRSHARNLIGSLEKHSSGAYLLPGGNDDNITKEDMEDLVNVLGANFDYIIMDFGTKPFFPYSRAGLELADKVYILALQEQGMVESLVSQFLTERREWVENGKAELVVNRVSPLGYYKPSQIARMAGFREWKEIPEDAAGFEAAKKAGKAVVQMRGAESSSAFYSIAGLIEDTQTPGFFKKLFKGWRK